jgi:exodeoxyribonuclease VII large subunit
MTDFTPFDSLEVAEKVALFPTPVFTGIGHDRNTSIADLMARQCKTPTKVAAVIVQHNFGFEQEITRLAEKAKRSAGKLLSARQEALSTLARLLKSYHPASVLQRGYALVERQGRPVVSIGMLKEEEQVRIRMSNGSFTGTVTDLKHEAYDL